eukprot:2562428-Rhodomonas_salina.1
MELKEGDEVEAEAEDSEAEDSEAEDSEADNDEEESGHKCPGCYKKLNEEDNEACDNCIVKRFGREECVQCGTKWNVRFINIEDPSEKDCCCCMPCEKRLKFCCCGFL